MRLITAYIQPFMIDRVLRQLRKAQVKTFVVTVSEYFGPECAISKMSLVNKTKLEIPVSAEQQQEILELVHKTVEPDANSDFLMYVTELLYYNLD